MLHVAAAAIVVDGRLLLVSKGAELDGEPFDGTLAPAVQRSAAVWTRS